MKFFSHLNTCQQILDLYAGDQPLAIFLKQFFSRHKKYGSKDRKQISHLCYCYFRLGKALLSWPVQERILAGLFFCSGQPNEILEAIKPAWNEGVSLSFAGKCSLLGIDPPSMQLFPWQEDISAGIDYSSFNISFFTQPDLFIRVRPGFEKRVMDQLAASGIRFTSIHPSCIALPNGSKIETLIALNKEAVVQDLSSQAVGYFFSEIKKQLPQHPRVWDCCAASGGKSIMAMDQLGPFDLTVSDIRESILANLSKRFREAGIAQYKSLVLDLAAKPLPTQYGDFDLIIADVPCTGSGTWARTPEQLFYFEETAIVQYVGRQQHITGNASLSLKPGGYFLYITCSVFKKENEEMMDTLTRQQGLQLLRKAIITGYTRKADTLFAALLQKPL